MNSKKVTTIFSIVFVLSLFALLVWALHPGTQVSNISLVSPIGGQNISGSLVVNISAAYITGGDGNITNATIDIVNGSDQSSTIGAFVVTDTDRSRNTSLSNERDWGAGIDTTNTNSGFKDGYYNISIINATNATEEDLGGQNGSYADVIINTTVLKIAGSHSQQAFFIVDNTYPPAPAVNSTNVSFYNFTTAGMNVTLEITAYNMSLTVPGDPSGTEIDRVTVRIENLTYGNFNLTADPYTRNGSKNSLWNLSFNQSNYTKDDGNYSFTVYVNDTAGNMNSTTGWFIIDTNGPTVSVSCSPASPVVGDTILCTCTATDAVSGVQTKTFTGTAPSSTAAGSFTTTTCTATDYARNSASATGSYTVSTAGSGGGSGGSGGGSSSGVASQFENRVWTSINAGEKATLTTKNGGIGVTDVSFVVDKTVYGAWLKVKLADTLPTTVPAYGKKVYKTVQITENNVESALTGNAVINFKVLKSWLTSSNLDKSGVALLHYVDNKWAELPTTVGQDDGTYVHYTAETPSFSYFVIGQKSGAAPAPVAEKAPTPTETPTDVTQPSTEEPVAAEASSSSTAVWVVVGIVLVALLAWVVLSLKKRR